MILGYLGLGEIRSQRFLMSYSLIKIIIDVHEVANLKGPPRVDYGISRVPHK